MNRTFFLVSALAAGLTLSSCETANQDFSGVDTRQSLKGLVVDGRVAGGTVWVDSDDDLEIDSTEPYATTDSQGYYGYNPNTKTQYCELSASEIGYEHCLVYGNSIGALTIRIKGGTDLGTGEKLKGLMAMFSSISESSSLGDDGQMLVLSPLTTLLSGIVDQQDLDAMKAVLGIDSVDDLSLDFSTADSDKTKKLLANAVAVQTMMDVILSATDSTASDSELQIKILKKITDSIISTGKAPLDFDTATIKDLVAEVSTDPDQQDIVSERVTKLNSLNKKIATAPTPEAAYAQIKASEVISKLVKLEADGTPAQKAAALKILGAVDGEDIANLSLELAAKLLQSDTPSEGDEFEFDITSITNSLVVLGEAAGDEDWDITDLDTVVEQSKLATGTQWGGSWFVVRATAEDSDELTVGSYLAVRLEGAADATSGQLAMCANTSLADSTDPDETFENEYFGGSWSKLNGGMVILNLTYNGQNLEGRMKAKVATTDQGQPLYRLETDIDGVTENGDMVLDVNGVSALENVSKPTSSLDCLNNVKPVIPAWSDIA